MHMTPRQCEIAAESYTASVLAQCGFDVLVQYGANQPHYDLVAAKDGKFLPISVKGSQDGGWMLAVRYVQPGVDYIQAIDKWLASQREDLIFIFVQYMNVPIGGAPRVYIARPPEIAEQLRSQCNGRGHGALHEDYKRDRPKSKYDHALPDSWRFSYERLESM